MNLFDNMQPGEQLNADIVSINVTETEPAEGFFVGRAAENPDVVLLFVQPLGGGKMLRLAITPSAARSTAEELAQMADACDAYLDGPG